MHGGGAVTSSFVVKTSTFPTLERGAQLQNSRELKSHPATTARTPARDISPAASLPGLAA